jgi:hypothetical protein
MSSEIVIIMKRTAKPTGLDQSNFNSVSRTANPVTVGLMNKRLKRRIDATAFRIKSPVFIDY